MKFNDLLGQRFGRLTVIKRAPNRGVKVNWLCQCDCGKQSVAFASDLRSGTHQSCGCLQKERVTKHSHAQRHTNGGSITYGSWQAMKGRCFNPRVPKYEYYGGRGITVCDRWANSFQAFLDDMGERPSHNHSIDRIDSDGDYTPDNCRWATRAEQSQNQRHAAPSPRKRSKNGRFIPN